MRKSKPLTFIIALLVISAPATSGQGEMRTPTLKPCREQPNLAGKCFRVRGRLSLYNGNPTIRLWRAGTKRMLGVSASYASEGYSSIPKEIEAKLNWENEVWGDFLVCPFTPQRPGEMQMMCIDEGRQIELRQRK